MFPFDLKSQQELSLKQMKNFQRQGTIKLLSCKFSLPQFSSSVGAVLNLLNFATTEIKTQLNYKYEKTLRGIYHIAQILEE